MDIEMAHLNALDGVGTCWHSDGSIGWYPLELETYHIVAAKDYVQGFNKMAFQTIVRFLLRNEDF